MADKKDGGDGDSKDGEHTLISFEEFLQRARERNEAQQQGALPAPKTLEEMIVDLCKLIGLISSAHDVLFQLYKMQSDFMLEHTPPVLIAEYVVKTGPLQERYIKAIERLKNPNF